MQLDKISPLSRESLGMTLSDHEFASYPPYLHCRCKLLNYPVYDTRHHGQHVGLLGLAEQTHVERLHQL